MKYVVHSYNGTGSISIRPIENGFLITYANLGSNNETYVENLEELEKWLEKFYTEKGL